MVEINSETVADKVYESGFEGIFTPLFRVRDSSLGAYLQAGGYTALERALGMSPEDVIEEVKKSGLRGRGGAGFPTGVKWGFIPKDAEKKYLVCNADEGEPGTFKDKYIISLVPHLLLEGMMIGGYAIGSRDLIVYIRGEYWLEASVLKRAIDEAIPYVKQKFNFDVNIRVMQGAGSYIVGEETGLLNSLEGKRGHPRPRPPYPAQKGFMELPTCVNNVETLAAVPFIIKHGADAFRKFGTEKSTGTKLVGISGNVKRPGIYEVPMGVPLKKIIELAGGTDCGGKIKAVIPGGTSTPPLVADELEQATLDYESLASFRTFLGTAACIVICECNDIWKVAENIAKFYAEESCGQCTTCREGTRFIEYLFHKIVEGTYSWSDVDSLEEISTYMQGSAICAHIDACAMPSQKIISTFRRELKGGKRNHD